MYKIYTFTSFLVLAHVFYPSLSYAVGCDVINANNKALEEERRSTWQAVWESTQSPFKASDAVQHIAEVLNVGRNEYSDCLRTERESQKSKMDGLDDGVDSAVDMGITNPIIGEIVGESTNILKEYRNLGMDALSKIEVSVNNIAVGTDSSHGNSTYSSGTTFRNNTLSREGTDITSEVDMLRAINRKSRAINRDSESFDEKLYSSDSRSRRALEIYRAQAEINRQMLDVNRSLMNEHSYSEAAGATQAIDEGEEGDGDATVIRHSDGSFTLIPYNPNTSTENPYSSSSSFVSSPSSCSTGMCQSQ